MRRRKRNRETVARMWFDAQIAASRVSIGSSDRPGERDKAELCGW